MARVTIPPCINHALMHSASGPCQTLNINESIIHCQEVTVRTAAHSWTGAQNSVDPSWRSIHAEENSVTEGLREHSRDNSDGMIVCYTARHLLIFHQNNGCGWGVSWRDAGTLLYDIQIQWNWKKKIGTLLNYTFTPQANVTNLFSHDSVNSKNHIECDISTHSSFQF